MPTSSIRFWFFTIVALGSYILYLVVATRIRDDLERKHQHDKTRSDPED